MHRCNRNGNEKEKEIKKSQTRRKRRRMESKKANKIDFKYIRVCQSKSL